MPQAPLSSPEEFHQSKDDTRQAQPVELNLKASFAQDGEGYSLAHPALFSRDGGLQTQEKRKNNTLTRIPCPMATKCAPDSSKRSTVTSSQGNRWKVISKLMVNFSPLTISTESVSFHPNTTQHTVKQTLQLHQPFPSPRTFVLGTIHSLTSLTNKTAINTTTTTATKKDQNNQNSTTHTHTPHTG